MDTKSLRISTSSKAASTAAQARQGEFIGREALLAVQASGGPTRKIVGLEMVDRGIGRDGYAVHDLEGNRIGQ